MSKDKVESRTELCEACEIGECMDCKGEEYCSHGCPDFKAARPSVPAQGQPVEQIRRNYKSADSFFRTVRGAAMLDGIIADTLAASRSEAQPPQGREIVWDKVPNVNDPVSDARRYQRLRVLGCAPGKSEQLTNGTVLRFTGLDAFVDADIAAHPSRGEADAPAAGLMPSCAVCGAIMRGVCPECNNTTGVSPAAGSAERWLREAAQNVVDYAHQQGDNITTYEGLAEALEVALAGTQRAEVE